MAKLHKLFGHARQAATITATADGTVASPTKTLVAADSGTHYYVDIDSNTVCIILPAVVAGVWYRFTLATASDAEASKDLIIATSADSVDMGGAVMDASGFMGSSALHEVTNATSKITIDSSTGGSNATVGDWLEFICDGTDWYVTGRLFGTTIVIADAR